MLPLQFIQDTIYNEEFTIYDPNTEEIRGAERQKCIGLECAAIWSM